mmetsp:Transcript_7738/g.12134  ORF Transcript_7738/g.12134 Transcript_7738/m.12134 type:complete len:208 (+) Transcript_7738:1372-1995(+)
MANLGHTTVENLCTVQPKIWKAIFIKLRSECKGTRTADGRSPGFGANLYTVDVQRCNSITAGAVHHIRHVLPRSIGSALIRNSAFDFTILPRGTFPQIAVKGCTNVQFIGDSDTISNCIAYEPAGVRCKLVNLVPKLKGVVPIISNGIIVLHSKHSHAAIITRRLFELRVPRATGGSARRHECRLLCVCCRACEVVKASTVVHPVLR